MINQDDYGFEPRFKTRRKGGARTAEKDGIQIGFRPANLCEEGLLGYEITTSADQLSIAVKGGYFSEKRREWGQYVEIKVNTDSMSQPHLSKSHRLAHEHVAVCLGRTNMHDSGPHYKFTK